MSTRSSKRRKTTHLPEAREGSAASTITCVHQQKPPATVQIDVHGDLCLKVGVNQCLLDTEDECLLETEDEEGEGHDHKTAVVYVVDSRAVSRASSVWRAMLNGAFAESNRPAPDSNKKWTVELPDDDPEPMLIILNIIHNHFDKVPRGSEMGIDPLYDLSVLTDKYDLTHLLHPWAEQWTAPVRDSLAGRDIHRMQPRSLLERYLWVAWELGDLQLFNDVYISLVFNTRISGGHLMTNLRTRLFSNGILEPPTVSGKCLHIYLRWVASR